MPLWLHEVISREGRCGSAMNPTKNPRSLTSLHGGGTGSTRSVCKLTHCKYIHQWARHGQDNRLKSLIRLRFAKVHLFAPGGPPTLSQLLLPTRLFIILSTSCFATILASSFRSGLSIFLCHSPVFLYFNSSAARTWLGNLSGTAAGAELLYSPIPAFLNMSAGPVMSKTL
jgi:hypothetical protein